MLSFPPKKHMTIAVAALGICALAAGGLLIAKIAVRPTPKITMQLEDPEDVGLSLAINTLAGLAQLEDQGNAAQANEVVSFVNLVLQEDHPDRKRLGTSGIDGVQRVRDVIYLDGVVTVPTQDLRTAATLQKAGDLQTKEAALLLFKRMQRGAEVFNQVRPMTTAADLPGDDTKDDAVFSLRQVAVAALLAEGIELPHTAEPVRVLFLCTEGGQLLCTVTLGEDGLPEATLPE